jgi:hypothetical protein
MKNRKLWYVIALGTLCLVAARMTVAQEQAPLPDAQAGAPLPDTGNPDQGPPPYPTNCRDNTAQGKSRDPHRAPRALALQMVRFP